MDKKRSFHHKKDEDEDEKKVSTHPKVEEVDEEEEETMSAGAKRVEDPLDDENAVEETAAPADDAEVDVEPARTQVEESKEEAPAPGPKINFDYAQSRTPSDVSRPSGGSNLDDLAAEPEEEYDHSQQPAGQAPVGAVPRPTNPYAQQSQGQDFGIRSIRQPQSGPSFPGSNQGGQNMNGNGNLRPQGQFGPPPGPGAPGNFNFRREGNYRSGGSNKVYFIVLLVIGLIVLGGAVYLLKNQLKPAAPKATPAPEVAISTPMPSATPEAIDRSKFTIRVLNGSGKTGLAGTVGDKLKSLGYKIEKTGNATNSAFLQTLVRTKDGATGLSDQLIKDLSDQSYVAASSSALKKDDTSDGEVIIGAK